MVFSSNYAGDAKSRNTGCNLCSSIPQKGQKGLEKLFKVQDSVEDLKSSGYLGMRKNCGGASFEEYLWQHVQNQEGEAGQTCMQTAHRASLWLWPTPPLHFAPWQKAISGDSNGTHAEQ